MGTPVLLFNLQSINNSKHNILAVCTQPPKKESWSKENFFSAYFSEKDKIKIRYPEKLDTIEEVSFKRKT